MSWWSRLANVWRPGRVDGDLDVELRFHLEARIEELVAAGLARDEAVRQATRRFGQPLRWREQSRDVKLLPWLDSLVRDVRFGTRALRRNAVVTTASVASLSLAIGGCVAAFAIVDALILRELPVRHPSRLVYATFPTGNADRPVSDTFNDPTFVRLREAGRGHVDLFAISTQVMRPVTFWDSGGQKERIRTQHVSGDAFERLGVAAAAGRLFTSADDTAPGASAVAIVSHAFWLRRFGGDPAIIGRSFEVVNERAREVRPLQIVGVADARFTGVEPGRPTDVWIPYTMGDRRSFGNYYYNWFRIFGRVRDGVHVDQAQSVLHAAFTSTRRELAGRSSPDSSPEGIARFLATPLHLRSAATGPSPLRQQFERPLWILAAIAGLVLIIAGSNVANLFLARTAARERELSLRLSIGASRGRLIQQVLIESALIATAATLVGLVVASIAAPMVTTMLASAEDPARLDLQFDWRLAAFSAALTLVITGLFGIVPALRASGVAPINAMQGQGRSSMRSGALRPFVAIQIAFGLMVLFVGGLLVLSFARLSSVNPGFVASNVLVLSIDTVQRIDAAQQRAAVLDVLGPLRTVPGVQVVSATEFGALGRAWTHVMRIPGTANDRVESTVMPIAPRYFEAMQVPILAGRGFDDADMHRGATAVIVNQAFASRYFGNVPALGRTLDSRFGENDGEGGHEIVGIAADTKYDLRRPPAPIIYLPLSERGTSTILVRAGVPAEAIVPRLREAVRSGNPLLRVAAVRTQASVVSQTLLRDRLLASLSGFFAAIGLALVAIGLYGVLSYAVVQRTREIGIRVALGSGQLGVIRAVLFDLMVPAAAGLAAGLAGGLYLSRFVQALLFEVQPLAFWSLMLPFGVLALAAAVAATVPALRAARVDPIVALRHD
jgi:putative ABC transport system permease protein